ncbi:zinc-finger domain-containing protein [Croceicoccus hydrothermalis]|uniref:zinc-finger domain-containing protein n=1 Tax=Croceicoccus hydrothermalis TaxID=2867964 RepID=UPI001EFB7385|nr:zinc-finger domain-containing protein [Croceicoccus hydrothermalis]
MIQPPETVYTDTRRVKCDGATDIRTGAALGHPRVWMEIDEKGYVECGYCDRRFVLKGGPAERGIDELSAGDLPEPGDAAVA